MFDIPEKGVKSSKHIQVTIKPLSLGYTANDTVRNTWEKMKSNPPPPQAPSADKAPQVKGVRTVMKKLANKLAT